MDQEIGIEAITDTINSMKIGTVPGLHGYTPEYYKRFPEMVSPIIGV